MTRTAFTLVELLVVMAISCALVALGVAGWSYVRDHDRLPDAANTITAYLGQAQAQARRDRMATGLRLYADGAFGYAQDVEPLAGGTYYPPNSDIPSTVRALAVPAPITAVPGAWLTGGMYLGPYQPAGTSSIVTIGNVDNDGGLVAVGDYLELQAGPVHLITAVGGSYATFTYLGRPYRVPFMYLQLATTSGNLDTSGPTCNYRILRRPRPLPGHDLLRLPTGTTLRFTGLPASVDGSIDLLFNPDGTVQGRSVGGTWRGRVDVVNTETGGTLGVEVP